MDSTEKKLQQSHKFEHTIGKVVHWTVEITLFSQKIEN